MKSAISAPAFRASTTYARASAAVPLLQQWLYGFAVASGLETFGALRALSENASCKFAPAVRHCKPRFFVINAAHKTRTKSLNLRKPGAAFCFVQRDALGFA
jgi:hypothetical protein